MDLDEFLTEAIAKRLKIPKERVTSEFMKKYYEEHAGELKNLFESDVATLYLKHVNLEESYRERLFEEAQQFIEKL